MNNKLFGKATALVMGSLVLFSSQALAISSNKNQELINAEALGESELLIAQANPNLPIQIQKRIALATAVSEAFTAVGDAAAIANASSFPEEKDKIAFARSLARASSIIGNSLAIANSNTATKGDAASIATSLAEAKTLIGDSTALASSKASSEDGPAIAAAGAKAETTVGNAVAAANAAAS